MFTNILIPTDGSELSMQANRSAIALAKSLGAKVTVLLVSPTHKQLVNEGFLVPQPASVQREWEKSKEARARAALDAVAEDARGAGVKCETLHVFRDLPYRAIVDVATKNGCDLIAMGSHGYGGFKQVILGSETTRVLSHTKIPVLVYR